ncbi:MAG: S8 family peptidase [Candidatus Roizmanbacteria bacterium]
MERDPRCHKELIRTLNRRGLALLFLTGISLLTSDTQSVFSKSSTSRLPISSEIIQSPDGVVITDGILSQEDLAKYSKRDVRQIYTYPLFGMAAYEVHGEGVKDLQDDPDIHHIFPSSMYPLDNSVENQEEKDTSKRDTFLGWKKLSNEIGINKLADLYHADVSDKEICIIDTAFDTSHPVLSNHIVHEACYSSTVADIKSLCVNNKDFDDNQSAHPASDSNCDGQCTHGTMTASTAIMNSSVKVSLFKTASAFGGDAPGLKDVDILAGFHGCLERKIAGYPVVAATLSASHYSTFSKPCNKEYGVEPYERAFAEMTHHGITVNLADGNFEEKSAVGSPACVVLGSDTFADGIISVASSTFFNPQLSSLFSLFQKSSLEIAQFSNRSENLTTIFAPGTDIPVATTGGYYGTASGTSFSTPITALSVAYLQSLGIDLTPPEIEVLIHEGGIFLKDGTEPFVLINLGNSAKKSKRGKIYERILPSVGVGR